MKTPMPTKSKGLKSVYTKVPKNSFRKSPQRKGRR